MNDEVYVEGIFNYLLQITKKFRFSVIKGEPEVTPATRHRVRLLALITNARRMAKKKYRQMPADFRTVHAEDDWIQEAMEILISGSLKYSPKRDIIMTSICSASLIGGLRTDSAPFSKRIRLLTKT